MRPAHPMFLLMASTIAIAGCAERIARGNAAPAAPPTGSDRASSTPSTRVAAEDALPEWLRIRLADYEALPAPSAPRAVYEVPYGDGVAYYVQAGCCDQLDPLIDARGVLVCYPTGGFTGRGDGRCLRTLAPADQRREVWRHH